MIKVDNIENLERILKNLGILIGHRVVSEDPNAGMIFEPRTITIYEIINKKNWKVIGNYRHEAVFQKDGETLSCEFGKYKPIK